MARKFVLTAELALRGPANLNQVVGSINKRLSNIKATVNLKINQQAAKNLVNVNTQIKNLNTLLAQTVKNSNSARTALQQLSQVFSSNNNAINTTAAALKNVGGQATKTSQQFAGARTAIEDFGFKSALALKRFAAFSLPAGALLAFTTAVKSGAKAAIDFQNEMVRLSQVTGRSLGQLQDTADTITKLSVDFGVSSAELSKVAVTLAQAGLSARDTAKALETIAKTDASPTFENMEQTGEGAIAMMRQFGISADELEANMSSLNSVAAAFAVESSDIITAVQRTGGAFKAAGGDFNELIALFTAVRQTTRESAETIATGFRTIFTRLQRPQTIKFLQEFGIELKDLEGKFVGPYEAVLRLSQGLAGLDTRDLKFAQITEELGGFRQISKVIPLIQQASVAQRALSIAQAGTNSLTRDAINAQESFARRIASVKEEFEALFRTLTSSSAFQTTLDIILGVASGLIKITEAASSVIPVLGALFAVKGIKALGGFTRGFGQQFGFLGGASGGGGSAAANTAAATVKQATATSANTAALASLNNSIQRLIQVLAASPTTFASASRPSRPRKFASGGLVPGTGNTDSVLTALMPGEYVIRKKAVEQIGAENLANVNRFAGGGLPDPRLEAKRIAAEKRANKASSKKSLNNITVGGPNDFAGLFFNPEGTDKQEYVDRLFASTNLSISKNVRATIADRAGLNPEDINNIRVPLKRFYLGADVRDTFDRKVNTGIKLLIKNLVDSYAQLKGYPGISGNDLDTISKSIPLESIKGSLFEGFISGVTQDFPIGDAQRTFDFEPGGKTRFSDLFGAGADAIRYADAKLTDRRGALDSIVTKALTKAAVDNKISVSRFAKGGSVPALVTPGEFIINSGSARKLGRSKLDELNRGGIPRFGTGTGGLSRKQKRRLVKLARAQNPNQSASKTLKQSSSAQRFGLLAGARTGISPQNIGVGGALLLAGTVPQITQQTLGQDSVVGAGISGATTGALTGATLGATFGPVGAAIGGVTGGLIGLATSLNEQAKAIREAQLVPVIERLGENISKINNNQIVPGISTSIDLSKDINKVREDAGIAGQATLFESFKQNLGFDTSAEQIKRRQAVLGNIQAPELLRAVQNIAGQFTNVGSFLNAGANTDLLKSTAELLGKSFNELKSEIDAQIQQRQKELSTLRGVEDFYSALSKLSIVEDIAGVFEELRLTTTDSVIAFNTLAAAAEGMTAKFEAVDISDLFKRPTLVTQAGQELARKNITDTLAPFGPSGNQLTSSILDLFEVKALLPDILDKLANTNLLDIEGTELADVFVSELRGANISEALKSQLADVFRSIVGNSKDPEIKQDIKKNRDAFASRITDPFSGITDAFANIAKARTDNINQLFDRIQKVVENSLKIEELKRGVGEQQIELLQFQNRKNKNFFLTSGQITAPFNESLQGLSGGRNAEQLRGSILENTKKQIAAQQALNLNPQDKDAKEAVLELTETLGKERAALTLLTQSVQEATKVQNELARVEAKIEAGQKETISAFDKIVFGTAEDQQALSRAFVVAQNANNQGFLKGISPKVLGETIGVLEQFPELFGEDLGKEIRANFIKSMDIPQNLKDKLIKGITDGNGDLRKKANELEKEANRLREQGIAASNAEIGLRADFNEQLRDTALTDFNNKTKELINAFDLLTRKILEQQNFEAQEKLKEAKGQKAAIEKLQGTVPGFEQFQTPDEIRKFVQSQAAQQLITDNNTNKDLLKRRGRAFDPSSPLLQGIFKDNSEIDPLSLTGQGSPTRRLTQAGKDNLLRELKNSDIGSKLSEETLQNIINQNSSRNVTDLSSVLPSEQIIRDINKQLLQALEVEIAKQTAEVNKSKQRLVESSGGRLDLQGVNTFLQQLGNINGLLEQIPEGENVNRLTTQIALLEKQARRTSNALEFNRNPNKLKALADNPAVQAAVQGIVGFARGGSIFKPKGTDTVPAMLTPGEFVINRKSAQANLPLIKQINDARGPVYAAGGRLINRAAKLHEDIIYNTFNAGSSTLRAINPFEFDDDDEALSLIRQNKALPAKFYSGSPLYGEVLRRERQEKFQARFNKEKAVRTLQYYKDQAGNTRITEQSIKMGFRGPDFADVMEDDTQRRKNNNLPTQQAERFTQVIATGLRTKQLQAEAKTRVDAERKAYNDDIARRVKLIEEQGFDKFANRTAELEERIRNFGPTTEGERRGLAAHDIVRRRIKRREELAKQNRGIIGIGITGGTGVGPADYSDIRYKDINLDRDFHSARADALLSDEAKARRKMPDYVSPVIPALPQADQARLAEIKKEQADEARHQAAINRVAEQDVLRRGRRPSPIEALAKQQAAREAIARSQQEALKENQARVDKARAQADNQYQAGLIGNQGRLEAKRLDDIDAQRASDTRLRLYRADPFSPNFGEVHLRSVKATQEQRKKIATQDIKSQQEFIGQIGVLGTPVEIPVMPPSKDTRRRLEREKKKQIAAATFAANRNPVPVKATDEQIKQNILLRAQQRKAARGYAEGGYVSGGIGFGDSVPAVLSRGEFVVNRGATAKIGVPTLQRFNKGGEVQYKQYGGAVDHSGGGGASYNENLTKLAQSVAVLGSTIQDLASVFKTEIKMSGTHEVLVTINGAEVLSKLAPSIQEMILSETNNSINKMVKSRLTYSGSLV